jgi:hypothetical protein
MEQPKFHMGMRRPRVERSLYRNGQLREEIHFIGSVLHGFHQNWHHNGKLASSQPYKNGLLHGLCRQWNRHGKLLGSFRMKGGTGIQREWFENGQLQMETSSVAGKFTGRTRVWLQDGTLVSEQYTIENRNVSPSLYAKIAAKNQAYPRYREKAGKVMPLDQDEIEKREFRLQVESLLSQPDQQEAAAWLKAGGRVRAFGLFKFADAQQLVQKLYDAGAEQVRAVNVYGEKSGKQFSAALLVQLPSEKSPRRAIRHLLTRFPQKFRAGVLPVLDRGEAFLYASFE